MIDVIRIARIEDSDSTSGSPTDARRRTSSTVCLCLRGSVALLVERQYFSSCRADTWCPDRAACRAEQIAIRTVRKRLVVTVQEFVGFATNYAGLDRPRRIYVASPCTKGLSAS
jgi:hypothetical protein